ERHAYRVVRLDASPLIEKPLENAYGGRFAQVVGIRLEGEAQKGHSLPRHRTAERVSDLRDHRRGAPFVHLNRRRDNPEREADLAGDLDDRARVLWKARTAVSRARVEKLPSDPLIEPHPLRYVVDVCPDPFAELGHLVDERDLCRE